MYYVYILYSSGYDKFYVGQTTDLETRLLFHNELSEKSFTSKYRPWVLKRAIEVENRSVAIRMERYIKGRKSKTYIQSLIDDQQAVHSLKNKFPSAG